MACSVLHITSQVEHTKECNRIDGESKYMKQNANYQNHLKCVSTHSSSTTVNDFFGLNRAL